MDPPPPNIQLRPPSSTPENKKTSEEQVTFPLPNSQQRVSSSSQQSELLDPNKPVVSSLNKPRAKIILEPGHSPLDWANLKKSQSLTKVQGINKFTLNDLKEHKSEKDIWVSLNGKVFDVTSYLNFHPGGKKMLMSVAGKDCTQQFMKYHSWVNADYLLDKCFIGFLVAEK